MSNNQQLPGLIDPPRSPRDEFILTTWMQQVTEAIRIGMGQTGDGSTAFITRQDLVNKGFLAPVSNNNYSLDYLDSNVSTDDVVFDLTPPPAVTDVLLSQLVGTIRVAWTPEPMTFPHHYEIWRTDTGDAADRVLVGTTSALNYTDVNVDDNGSYTYWVRVAKSVGNTIVYSAFDNGAGTNGSPKSSAAEILDIVSEDFYIKTPNGEVNPFTYRNLGTTDNPDWKVALLADVAIEGALAISQLQSGELPDYVDFTIGNSSIIMDTRTDGSGEIVITGNGGPTGNDYLILNQGTIDSYVWNGTTHVPYKNVKRVERGVAQSGQTVVIPAYFKTTPELYLTPAIVPTYNPAYKDQGQQWRLTHSNPVPNANIDGAWDFVPIAQLELAAASVVEYYSGMSYGGSSDSEVLTIPGQVNLNTIRIRCLVSSARETSNTGTWYNRKVTAYLETRLTGGAWIQRSSATVTMTGSSQKELVLYADVPDGYQDVRVRFVAEDSGGTYNTGTVYEYTTRPQVYVVPDVLAANKDQNGNSIKITRTYHPGSVSGWSYYSSVSQFNVGSYELMSASDNNGPASIRMRDQSWKNLFYVASGWNGSNHANGSLSINDSHNGALVIHADSGGRRAYMSGFTIYSTHTYRRIKPSSTTPTNFYSIVSAEVDRGATIINPAGAVSVNWIAIGE